MLEVIFLVILALIWIIFAVIQDLREREIANWISFSLIIFALGFRFFFSLFGDQGFNFFYQGLIGLGIFFVLGNFLYYGRMFGGGDAKLFFALGAILPFSSNFFTNLDIFILFLVLFIFSGAIYGIFFSSVLIFKNLQNFKKEFSRQFKLNKKLLILTIFLALFFVILGFFNPFMFYFGILIFILQYLYLSAKAIDEVCMIKKVLPGKLTEGDLLYQNVKVENKLIEKNWQGLNKKEIGLLKRKRYVLIRQGIPYTPVFLVSFLVLVLLWFSGLWNSFW